MTISPGSFLIFSKFWFFWVVRGLKGQKTVQNDKKFCPLHSTSQKPYIIWLSFMVHICKMIISSDFFLIYLLFFKFSFSGYIGRGGVGGKRAKNGSDWQNILFVALNISGTMHHMIFIYGGNVENDNISRYFLNLKILIFQVVRGLKEQKMAQNNKNFHLWYRCM